MSEAPDPRKAEKLEEVNLTIRALVLRLNAFSAGWEARFGAIESASMRTTVLAHILAHGIAAEALIAVRVGRRPNGKAAIKAAANTVTNELTKRALTAYAVLEADQQGGPVGTA